MARHKRRRSTARPAYEGDRPDHEAPGEGGRGERLQKVLAAAGVDSRRDCEELIREGRVQVDGQVVTELGTRVDPLRQEIRVDTEVLRQPKRQYFAVNKPINVVTTNFDPSGRPRVIDLVPTEERVFAVGRLDRASEGLILVTNDGEFANRITHPRYGVDKSYLVRVAGQPTTAELDRLKKGVYLSDGFCRVQSITAKKRQGKSTDLVMVLNEGRNREVRRILARVGHKVLRLKRIAVGPIKLADLPTGAWRKLLPTEVENLLHLAKEKRKAGKSKRKPARPAGASKPVHGKRDESPYLQQQALMAQPLSLDDLLRDDLDEGNLAGTGGGEMMEATGEELRFSDDAPLTKRGAVIGEPEAGEQPAGFKPRGKKPFRKPQGQRSEQRPQGARPGKKFGRTFDRKPGGHSSLEGERGGGPPKPGSKRFGKPGGKPGGKKFGKPTAEKFGKPGGKKFGKPGGKKFGKPGGKRFGKPFGKQGGRRGERP
jgi:23S rRNA pseudouridine2605 synthase